MGEKQEGAKVEQEKQTATVVATETTDNKPNSAGGDSTEAPAAVAVASAFVYKVDMHCGGCAKKIKRMVKHLDGVKDVTADMSGNKLTVVGKIDPVKLRGKLEEKMKRKVVLTNPPPPLPLKVDASAAAATAVGEKKSDGVDKAAAPPPPPAAPRELGGFKDQTTLRGITCASPHKETQKNCRTSSPATIDDGAAENNKTEAAAPTAGNKEGPASGVSEAKKEGNEPGENKKGAESTGENKKEAEATGEKKKEIGDGGEKKKETGDGVEKKESGGGGGTPVAMVNKMDYYEYSYPTAPMYLQEGHVYSQTYSLEDQSYSGSGYNYMSESYVPYSHPNMNAPPGMFSDENPNGCSIM
ncbi:hypothetical protein DY000_02001980 [Brassica cretica]|uniref:HMA domain-containing protein n=1 Tax=Brassica cretica TaxID=69181 RepID=A0ABQ7CGU0_BRACR|nr:hypothetical protein DY000_02001980 [Brassica cretica]